MRPGDVVMLHDPQTAALVAPMREVGARVVWRCHVGIDEQNDASELAWSFLRPYIEAAHAFVFSRAQFAPPWVPRERLVVIAPSIDPFSAKNEPMDADLVRRTLRHVGVLTMDGLGAPCEFTRRDGSRGRRRPRVVDLVGTSEVPADAPLVVQASRWDALKDMPGVMLGFAEHCDAMTDAHLLLAGPEVNGCGRRPRSRRRAARVPLAVGEACTSDPRRVFISSCVPMDDSDEAAAMVNAMQRHATVVVQKSLAEGFGLTVAEAMWKSRPVIGSAVGGITDQIVDGETGVLLPDPTDLTAYTRTLRIAARRRIRGCTNGRERSRRVRECFLPDRHLAQWAALFDHLTPE